MTSKLFNPKFILCMMAIFAVIWISPDYLYSLAEPPPRTVTLPRSTSAATKTSTDAAVPVDLGIKAPSIISQGVALAMLAMMPFIVMMLTSFLKIVIVLSLLRTALGVQQAPPNQVINGIAFMLSMYVMYPTGLKMYDIAQASTQELRAPDSIISPDSPKYIIELATKTAEPMREFLKKNSLVKHQILFYRLSYRVLPEQHKASLKPDDFIILVPAFITSQLKDAFEIGVLIYIPFFVIDLVTSNILLAMGMMMLSPVTISMPLKLFLLVMLDGWTLLIQGLVGTFQV